MHENLPKKYNENFFNKIIINIKKIIFKNKYKNEIANSNITNSKKDINNNMLEELKVNVDFNYNNEYEKKQFMNNLSKNPQLLETLSNERLKKVLQWYKDENEKKKEILRRLNS